MSYTACLYHIVFGTYYRRKAIPTEIKDKFKSYIIGIAKNNNSNLIAMNAMSDHVHILINLHPTVALAEIVKNIKQSSSIWIKDYAPNFVRWSHEYYGVSLSPSAIDRVTNYINNQEQHHFERDFAFEIKFMIESAGMKMYMDSFIK